MKKSLLFLLVAAWLPVMMMAQQYGVVKFNGVPAKSSARVYAPERIDLPANQKIMSHYESDNIATEGYMFANIGVQPIAIMMDPEELEIFQGGKIVAIRVGLVEAAEVSRVFVIPVSASGKYGTKTEWTCSVGSAGWNMVELETPYEINIEEGGKLLVGYYFKQEMGAKPISLVQEGEPYDCYTYKKVGSSSKWRELNFTSMGNLSLQCIVEKESYPDYMFKVYNMRTNEYQKAGSDLPFMVDIKNKGNKAIAANELSVNVLIDGEQVTTLTNDAEFVGNQFTLNGYAPTDGLEAGEHTLTVQVAAVNGETIEDPASCDGTFKFYQRDFPRQKHLVEQLTSTYCTYCPLGNSMLSLLTSQRDDIVWVGLHGNLGSGVDPYRSDQADSIMVYLTGGSISYPSGAFDRSTGWEDDVNVVNGLGFYEQYHQEVADMLGEFFDYLTAATPTFAEIKGSCLFNKDTREATVTISGELCEDFPTMFGEDAKLTVYLVEDSLVASQLNNGSWVRNYRHNGVFRAALGSVLGNSLNISDNGTYKNKFKYTIPNGWNVANMRVVAFISRPLSNGGRVFTDLIVNNAADFFFEDADGVEESRINEGSQPVEYYDLMGRQHNGLQPGLNIVKMSDGTARKIIVK